MSWEEAEGKAASWLKTQAALHNPDQIAGKSVAYWWSGG